MILSEIIKAPLYSIIGISYIGCLILQEFYNIPKTISMYNKKQKLLDSSVTYIDFDTYQTYIGDLYINQREFKDYIYVNQDETMVKAYLMINKKTHKLSYVLNDISICDDIEQHRIKKNTL